MLNSEERKILLHAARESIRSAARGGPEYEIPVPLRTPALMEFRACFVTIHKGEALRGCIGQVQATRQLHAAVVHSAYSCATSDPRFPAVTPDEVDVLAVEVSVLTSPTELAAQTPEELLRMLEPGRQGVLLKIHGRTSTFLPQVWQTLPEKETFLASLSRKAGLSATAWRERDACISVYEVESFETGPLDLQPTAG